jgi:roadblock/LC7 domain-containing protein
MESRKMLKPQNKMGYALIAVGFALILIGLIILMINIGNNQFSAYGYANRFNFWYFQAPIIAYSIVAGSFVAVIGIAILSKITNVISYVSIIFGFVLSIIDVNSLFVDWVKPNINIIGFGNFSSFSSGFFSYLMAGAFFAVLGIILGLNVRGKLGYISVTGGLAVMLVGVSVLMVNLGDHTSSDWTLNLRLSWAPVIFFSLITGMLIVIVGTAYLIVVRHKKLDDIKG